MKYTEEIQILLSSLGVVSCKYIALKFNISILSARECLVNIYDGKKDYLACYLIEGISNNNVRVCTCEETEVVSKKGEFSVISFAGIWSLHTRKSSLWREELAQLEFQQVNSLICEPKFVNIMNSISSIILPNNNMLPAGERLCQIVASYVPTPPINNISTKAKSTECTPPVASSTKVAPSAKSSSVSSFFPSKTTATSTSIPAPAVKPVSAPMSSPVNERPIETSASLGSNEKSTRKSKIIDDDEEEWEDGSGYKTDKANLAKRLKQSNRVLDDDDAWEKAAHKADTHVEPLQLEEATEETKTGKRKSTVTRGAMDDFVNDHSFESDAVIGGNTSTGSRKKKLVEKTFEDEKGYLVTQMVWVEMTDEELAAEEAAAVAKAKAAAATAAKKPVAAPLASKPKTAAGGSAQQKGMMAFFGKKN